MQAHEEIIKRAVKLSPAAAIQLLSDVSIDGYSGAEAGSVQELEKYITSIWKEHITVRGEAVAAYRVFVRLDCSHDLARVGWLMEEDLPNCVLCGSAFGMFTARSHCRACGNLICQSCRTQSYLEGMEVYGEVPVCTQCCWGQRIVTLQRTPRGTPQLIRDLGNVAHYTLTGVDTCYVLSCSSPDSLFSSVYINISSCPLVPSSVPGADPSAIVLCGCQRQATWEKDQSFTVFDIVVHPDTLISHSGAVRSESSSPDMDDPSSSSSSSKEQHAPREAIVAYPPAEVDRRCLEQIILFIERFFYLSLASAKALKSTYFDPALVASTDSELKAVTVKVHFPIPPLHLFERYLQVPLLGGDRVQVHYLPTALSLASAHLSLGAAEVAALALERWQTDASDTSTVVSDVNDLGLVGTPMDNVHNYFKLLTHTWDHPRGEVLAHSPSGIDLDDDGSHQPHRTSHRRSAGPDKNLRQAAREALTAEEVVDFHNPDHVLAVLTTVTTGPSSHRTHVGREGGGASTLSTAHNHVGNGHGHGGMAVGTTGVWATGGLRTPPVRVFASAPKPIFDGTKGRADITSDMLIVDKQKSIDSASAERLRKAAKKNRRLLIGWQVMVYTLDGREMKGVYIITGQKRNHSGNVYRLTNFEEEDQWVPLSSRLNSKGYPYLPLRQVGGQEH